MLRAKLIMTDGSTFCKESVYDLSSPLKTGMFGLTTRIHVTSTRDLLGSYQVVKVADPKSSSILQLEVAWRPEVPVADVLRLLGIEVSDA